MKQIIFLLFLLSCTAVYAQQQDSVTIHGRVTDYNGQPIDSASVWWQNPQFNDIIEAITDKDGHYTARIPKGKYQSAASIYLPSYAHIAMKSGLPETEHRLEFWAWDFIADRDTRHTLSSYGSLWPACFLHPRSHAYLSDIRPSHELDTYLPMDERNKARVIGTR